jgi:hypothetical protein
MNEVGTFVHRGTRAWAVGAAANFRFLFWFPRTGCACSTSLKRNLYVGRRCFDVDLSRSRKQGGGLLTFSHNGTGSRGGILAAGKPHVVARLRSDDLRGSRFIVCLILARLTQPKNSNQGLSCHSAAAVVLRFRRFTTRRPSARLPRLPHYEFKATLRTSIIPARSGHIHAMPFRVT